MESQVISKLSRKQNQYNYHVIRLNGEPYKAKFHQEDNIELYSCALLSNRISSPMPSKFL